jgi:hypothetical protein
LRNFHSPDIQFYPDLIVAPGEKNPLYDGSIISYADANDAVSVMIDLGAIRLGSKSDSNLTIVPSSGKSVTDHPQTPETSGKPASLQVVKETPALDRSVDLEFDVTAVEHESTEVSTTGETYSTPAEQMHDGEIDPETPTPRARTKGSTSAPPNRKRSSTEYESKRLVKKTKMTSKQTEQRGDAVPVAKKSRAKSRQLDGKGPRKAESPGLEPVPRLVAVLFNPHCSL